MAQTKIILVGGFLGAGKTTLLGQAARALASQGQRVSLVTNDQTDGLVDSALLRQQGFGVGEVSGGCFCCRFEDFVSAVDDRIQRDAPDVVLAEPVGSCTDLSATVLQPIKKLHGAELSLAPFSVVVDPARLAESLGPQAVQRLTERVIYVYRKQLEESDVILLNKIDTLTQREVEELRERLAREFPGRAVLPVSGRTGEGVGRWLQLLAGAPSGGGFLTAVDYDIYAAGEADLGWLNASIGVTPRRPVDWRAVCLHLLQAVRDEVRRAETDIAHLKTFASSGRDWLAANLTGVHGEVWIEGDLRLSDAPAELLVNARIQMGPEVLRGTIERQLHLALDETADLSFHSVESFSPARPVPVHRFTAIA